MMNRLVYSALAIFCFAIVSCIGENPVQDDGQNHIVLNVFNSQMTKAEDNTSTAYERQLNRLDCFFYVKDQTNEPCVYYHRIDLNDLDSATISFIVTDLVLREIFPSGSMCDVFVIANIPGNPTFEAKGEGTSMPELGERVLNMTEGEYDAVGKPFVMTGHNKVQKGKNSNATADISLARVASKVTMTVKVPKTIEIENNGNKVTMLPLLADNEGRVHLKTSFRYGTKISYLSEAYPDDPNYYIFTDKIPYTMTAQTDTHYVFTCNMPFYTYARSWEKGSDNAAYVTFEMPWGVYNNDDGKVESYNTYYYQILVNGKNRNFTPNTHYDMIVTVGVLGSTVESTPKVLDQLSYYILDWTTETSNGDVGSGDRDENVEIDKFNYLEVPQTYIEMDNVSTVAIRYNASHKIGWEFDTKGGKTVEGLPGTTSLSAFYISNYDSQTQSGTPTAKDLGITLGSFTDDNKGWLTFTHTLANGIYSPAYVFITIWLDVNGNGVHDSEEKLTQDVKIVIYPAIYIVGDNSATRSIFVNGNYGQAATKQDYLTIANQQVGKAVGQDASTYMHIISISAFSDKNHEFVYLNNDKKRYIIGDPRVRVSYKLDVPNDNSNNPTTPKQNATGWIKATDVNGVERYLENYYPTSTEVNSYQVIAPKFRIASKLGGYSECAPKGAAYRCASYQEHGFPAGRWRLPTTAEILFIVELQKQDKIKELFYGGNTYFSATDRVKVNDNNSYSLTEGLGTGNASVRCVYDEWYWGSEREALDGGASYDNYGGYQFTWGDRKIY